MLLLTLFEILLLFIAELTSWKLILLLLILFEFILLKLTVLLTLLIFILRLFLNPLGCV